MTPTKKRIAQYRFEDSIQRLNATIAGNFLLAFFLMMPDFNNLLQNHFAHICLLSAIFVFVLKKNYEWKSSIVNLAIVGIYLGLLAFEYFKFGLPGYLLNYDWDSYQVSKGIMFDILIWTLPSIYLGTRLILVIPLVLMLSFKKTPTG